MRLAPVVGNTLWSLMRPLENNTFRAGLLSVVASFRRRGASRVAFLRSPTPSTGKLYIHLCATAVDVVVAVVSAVTHVVFT